MSDITVILMDAIEGLMVVVQDQEARLKKLEERIEARTPTPAQLQEAALTGRTL